MADQPQPLDNRAELLVSFISALGTMKAGRQLAELMRQSAPTPTGLLLAEVRRLRELVEQQASNEKATPAPTPPTNILTIEALGLTVDLEEKAARRGDDTVILATSPVLWAVFVALVESYPKRASRETLMGMVWQDTTQQPGLHTVTVHVSNLNSKLEPLGVVAGSERSRGYLLQNRN